MLSIEQSKPGHNRDVNKDSILKAKARKRIGLSRPGPMTFFMSINLSIKFD